jgi:hypothetical protein
MGRKLSQFWPRYDRSHCEITRFGLYGVNGHYEDDRHPSTNEQTMKTMIILLSLLVIGEGLRSQNLDIQGKAKIHSSDTGAVLDLQGEGFVLPRLTNEERENILHPQFGLLILNTSTNCLEIYLQEWTPLCPGGGPLGELIGGSSKEVAYSMAETSDGGYVVAGYSNSSASGDVSGMNSGQPDYWIVKLNSGGGIEWDTLLGGSSEEEAYSIAQTSDGGYIVAGYSASSASGDVSGVNNGEWDYWIVKLNSGGGIEWDTLLGGSYSEAPSGIAQTSDSGYIVAGYSFSSASGDVTGTNNGVVDYWIVKLNSGGGIE